MGVLRERSMIGLTKNGGKPVLPPFSLLIS